MSGIESFLTLAVKAFASDLAIDPQDDGSLKLIARIDGIRRPLGTIPAANASQAIARLKALAAVPAYITDEAQDGRIDGRAFGVQGDLRFAAVPTIRGQRVAVRLPALGALPAPDALGLSKPVLTGLRQALRRSEGLVLITGPTGSGKSTTIHSLLAELAVERPDRQIVTIEDPVERRVPGLVQIEIAPARKFGYEEALAASLRQDADVLVVGEVRDRATAAACLTAALTGHLVVSTLHCGRAGEAVRRLVDLGVDVDHLLSALSCVVAQRLVRRRHTACDGNGCDQCSGGWSGRAPVCDLLLADPANRTRMRAGTEPALAVDLDDEAAALVAAEITTANEVRRAVA